MNEQLSYTISEMYRLAYRYRDDLAPYRSQLNNIFDVFDFVREIPYVPDKASCGTAECLKRPKYGIIEGDCDDKSIVAASALYKLGVPFELVTVSYSPNLQAQHVYLQVLHNGKWYPFDATYSHSTLFTERPYTYKQRWSNPMPFGVRVLEGQPLGIIPVAAASALIGKLEGVTNFLKSIPGIGALLKGKTQHVPHDVAEPKQKQAWEQISSVYDLLDAEGKKFYHDLHKKYYDDFRNAYGSWWDGWVNNRFNKQTQDPVWSNERYRNGFYGASPIYDVMTQTDMSRVDEDLQEIFLKPYTSMVTNLLTDYLNKKYGVQSVEQFQQQGPAPGAGFQLSSFGSNPILLIGLALAGVAMFAGTKSQPRKVYVPNHRHRKRRHSHG